MSNQSHICRRGIRRYGVGDYTANSLNIIPDGLSVWYDASFGYGGGTNIEDLSGNGISGTLFNGITVDPILSALIFNGSNQYISFAAPAFDYITIGAFIKADAGGNGGYVINKNYNGNNVPYSLNVGGAWGGSNGISYYSGGWYCSGFSTDIRGDGKWHYIAGTFDGVNLIFYIDGIQDSSATVGAMVLPKNSNNTDIGRYAGDNAYFNGEILSIQLYNRALNPLEILQNYNVLKERYIK